MAKHQHHQRDLEKVDRHHRRLDDKISALRSAESRTRDKLKAEFIATAGEQHAAEVEAWLKRQRIDGRLRTQRKRGSWHIRAAL